MILVDADRVTMTRPGRALFDEVSLTMSTGDRLGIVGLNGTGKSTLLDVLAGRREPESGQVRTGRDVRIAMLDQNPDLGTGTVRDAVESVAEAQWEIDAVLDKLGMGGRDDDPVAQLSGGEAKRVALARALFRKPALLLLDDATSALDPTVEAQILRGLDDRPMTILMVAHRLSTIALADRVAFLEDGRIRATGTHDELLQLDSYRTLVQAYEKEAA